MLIKRALRPLWLWLERLCGPSNRELVHAVIAGTCSLELAKSDSRTIAPLPGMFGPVTIRGNSIPDFTYLVFDEALMEFPEVRALLSLPDNITFVAKTPDLGDVPVKPEYEAPFRALLKHLGTYFPLLTDKKDVIRVG